MVFNMTVFIKLLLMEVCQICYWLFLKTNGAIDYDNLAFHVCYIINFTSCPFIIWYETTFDGKVLYSGELICGGTY